MRLIFVLSVLPLLPLSISTHLIQPPAFSLSTDKKHFRSIFIPLFEGWQRSTTRTDQVGGNKISNFNWSFANFQRSNTMTPKEAALAGRGGLTRFKRVHLLSKNVYDLHKVEAASLLELKMLLIAMHWSTGRQPCWRWRWRGGCACPAPPSSTSWPGKTWAKGWSFVFNFFLPNFKIVFVWKTWFGVKSMLFRMLQEGESREHQAVLSQQSTFKERLILW